MGGKNSKYNGITQYMAIVNELSTPLSSVGRIYKPKINKDNSELNNTINDS
jgi:hypothetical protein